MRHPTCRGADVCGAVFVIRASQWRWRSIAAAGRFGDDASFRHRRHRRALLRQSCRMSMVRSAPLGVSFRSRAGKHSSRALPPWRPAVAAAPRRHCNARRRYRAGRSRFPRSAVLSGARVTSDERDDGRDAECLAPRRTCYGGTRDEAARPRCWRCLLAEPRAQGPPAIGFDLRRR